MKLSSLCLLLWLLVPAITFAQDDDAHKKYRAFSESRVTSDRLVFAGHELPPVRIEPDSAVRAVKNSFYKDVFVYDRAGEVVQVAVRPGPYAAIMHIKAKDQKPSVRMATLFRLEQPIGDDEKFSRDTLGDLAAKAGIDPAAVKLQADLVLATLKDRPWRECAADPRVADLLTGLLVSPPQEKTPRKNLDAMAMTRQYWVEIRSRSHRGVELDSPKKIKDLAAPIVRKGTLAEAGMSADAVDKIDATLQAYAADTDEAFAVCVVRRGVIVIHRAYGTRDGQPMTVKTKSWMASITKPMSATLMMMLVDQGAADLDQPLHKYVPELDGIPVAQPLTIRHLYTHTNGLEKWPGFSDECPDVAARVADIYPQLAVGKTWGYNGLGYTLGGKTIENLTGEAIPLCYVKHLLGPLGMDDTDVIGTHADARSVPLDIAKFGQMLLNRGSYGDLQFMRAETFDKMLPRKLTITLGPEAEKTFGIGLDGQPGSGKFGHGAASAATFSVDSNDQLVVVMTRNKIGTNYDKYNGKFWEAIKSSMAK